jgi:hypothetical protein
VEEAGEASREGRHAEDQISTIPMAIFQLSYLRDQKLTQELTVRVDMLPKLKKINRRSDAHGLSPKTPKLAVPTSSTFFNR